MKPKVLFMMLVLMIGWAWNAAVCEGQSGKGNRVTPIFFAFYFSSS